MRGIVRSICVFTRTPDPRALTLLREVEERLAGGGFTVQTKRVVSPGPMARLADLVGSTDVYPSVGSISLGDAVAQFDVFRQVEKMCCHLDLTDRPPTEEDVAFLTRLIAEAPEKTFYFAYAFSNATSSPYFPASSFERPGFSVGLQPTDLAAGCETLEEWLDRMLAAWNAVVALLDDVPGFLGVDSSVAPLGPGPGSFVGFVRRFHPDFSRSLISDVYVRVSGFIKEHNPRPVGLCGLMFPCLEDFELADEYAKGNFDLATNIYLSLHCGLGIDTYPIGVDEDPRAVLDVLMLMRALAGRYGKPLSARFVSDGLARIGERTNFRNEFLHDVVVRTFTR
ncbi:DUF711 family protein [Microtetraspora glauca]|uniref:DUF711 family protein n=1 Tax=Microtetraspora glauca TaxID=1996 RepID=A0ABV3G6Q5_MICGL